MKKNNYSIILLFFLFLLYGCQDVKKGFSGKTINEGEEFLVIKKNPLEVPPDFEEMPLPKSEINITNSTRLENAQDNDFEKLLKTQDKNTDVSTTKENTEDLENKIIDKIR